jgi:hypothetical protein
MFHPSLLYGMIAIGAQTLNGGNHSSVYIIDSNLAGTHCLAINVYGAGSAMSATAAKLRSSQLKILPQYPQQRCIWLLINKVALIINLQSRHGYCLPIYVKKSSAIYHSYKNI